MFLCVRHPGHAGAQHAHAVLQRCEALGLERRFDGLRGSGTGARTEARVQRAAAARNLAGFSFSAGAASHGTAG